MNKLSKCIAEAIGTFAIHSEAVRAVEAKAGQPHQDRDRKNSPARCRLHLLMHILNIRRKKVVLTPLL